MAISKVRKTGKARPKKSTSQKEAPCKKCRAFTVTPARNKGGRFKKK